jgi:predicted O-methyltransferase YrrM
MDILNPLAEQYCTDYSSSHDVLSQEIETYTNQHHGHAHMLSGKWQGKFLEMISLMIKPTKVLEIGSFTGFSALCLSKGLIKEGHLHTIEIREEDAKKAQQFFQKSSVNNQITLHVGNAIEIIQQLDEVWDLIFIDADKVSYIEYYELTLPRLNSGGWILVDNVFFHGQVFSENLTGKNAKAIDAFNKYVAADLRVEQVMIPIRDGLMLIRKL